MDTESSIYVMFWLVKTWGLQIKGKTGEGMKYLPSSALFIGRQDKAGGTNSMIFPDSMCLQSVELPSRFGD